MIPTRVRLRPRVVIIDTNLSVVISPLAAIGNGSLRRALSHVRASMQEYVLS